MALPELPDDRRARPQRFSPAGPPAGRHAVRTPPEGQPATPVDGRAAAGPRAGDRLPGSGPAAAGRPHRPVNGNAPANGNGGVPVNGHGRANGQVPVNGNGNGSARGSAAVAGGPPRRLPPRADVPAGGTRSAPADGARPATSEAAGARRGPIPPPVRGVRPPVPPQRSVPEPDDEPTEVHDDLAAAVDDPDPVPDKPAADANPEFPGRHRRRAGSSPDSRPASEYKAQAAAARGGKKARPGRRRRENFWRELPLLIVVALVLTFTIQTFLAKVYVIPSGSMETTLNGCTGCDNDRVLVDKVTYRFRDPQPGDVVVFRGPDGWTNTEFSVPRSDNALVNGLQQFGSLIGLAPPDEKDFVKRVIAVGGQTVQCCDSRDRLMVDGEPLDEPYVYFLPEAGPAREQRFDPVTVPEGQLWMMGDSRNNSSDSRAQGHGAVPVENVIGQARLIVLPFGRFGWIDSIDPQTTTAVGMGSGAGAPLAMGLLGTLPLAVWRRRRAAAGTTFLP